MTTNPTRLDVDVRPERRLIVLRGDIDSHTAGALEAELVSFGPDDDVTVDLNGIGFIDSSGLRVLIGDHQSREAKGAKLVLRSPSEAVTRLLEITGVHEHLHLA